MSPVWSGNPVCIPSLTRWNQQANNKHRHKFYSLFWINVDLTFETPLNQHSRHSNYTDSVLYRQWFYERLLYWVVSCMSWFYFWFILRLAMQVTSVKWTKSAVLLLNAYILRAVTETVVAKNWESIESRVTFYPFPAGPLGIGAEGQLMWSWIRLRLVSR